MKSYQDVENYLTQKVVDLSHEKSLIIAEWIIRQIVQAIPDNFAENELEEEQPLLQNLKNAFDEEHWDLQNIHQILMDLQDVMDNYGDDYPADMEFIPVTLIVVGEYYADMKKLFDDNTEMLTQDFISESLVAIIYKYLDVLDYYQDMNNPDEMIDNDIWATYPIIQKGVQSLQTKIDELQ